MIREPFNGTGSELPRRWHDIDGDWRRAKGSARIVEGSVSARTNVAYSVRQMRSSYGKRGMAITTKIRLSPGLSNIGIVGPFRDVGNHLFCKVERTKPHPEGFLAIGRRLHGHKPAILVHENQIGLEAGQRYILKATRKRSKTTCSISQSGTRLAILTYTMRPADRAAFGSGRKVGSGCAWSPGAHGETRTTDARGSSGSWLRRCRSCRRTNADPPCWLHIPRM